MLTQAELEKIHADIVRLRAETMKLVGPVTRTPNVEARQFTRETFWYPLAFAIGLFATVAGLTVWVTKLLN
ncbi:hypothetical protein [Pseudomonas lini]|uniref:hypothetical protein n=1 Tax=Pseudomonas lini TaxID=163011 RepID=UPI00345E9B9F